MVRSAQTLMKSRLAGATKGHGLLKKKADALQMRFRLILGKIIEVCTNIDNTMRDRERERERNQQLSLIAAD